MTGHASDAISVEWNGVDSCRRRMVFEDRGSAGWLRISQRHNGVEWVTTGQEIVADLDLDAPAAVIRDGSPTIGD